eukprot:554790-Pelagomonas_calceolata.AAC.1
MVVGSIDDNHYTTSAVFEHHKPAVRDAIDKIISVKPELRGLKTHIGNNASNIVLSYPDRREALDPRSPAAAFVYPTW